MSSNENPANETHTGTEVCPCLRCTVFGPEQTLAGNDNDLAPVLRPCFGGCGRYVVEDGEVYDERFLPRANTCHCKHDENEAA